MRATELFDFVQMQPHMETRETLKRDETVTKTCKYSQTHMTIRASKFKALHVEPSNRQICIPVKNMVKIGLHQPFSQAMLILIPIYQ